MALPLAGQLRLLDAGLDGPALVDRLIRRRDGNAAGLDCEHRLVGAHLVVLGNLNLVNGDGIAAHILALGPLQRHVQRVAVHQALLAPGQLGVNLAVGLGLVRRGHHKGLPRDLRLQGCGVGVVVVLVAPHHVPHMVGPCILAGGHALLEISLCGRGLAVRADSIEQRPDVVLDAPRLDQRLFLAAVHQRLAGGLLRRHLLLQYGHGHGIGAVIVVVGVAIDLVPDVVGSCFGTCRDRCGIRPSGSVCIA